MKEVGSSSAVSMLGQDQALPKLESLVERLANLVDLTVPEVLANLEREHRDLGCIVRETLEEWKIEPHVWSDRLVQFYSETQAMIFETVVWNYSATKRAMRQWILDFLALDAPETGRVLTFGDGLGFDSLALAKAGHEVDYYEVGEASVRFTEGLFRDSSTSVKVLRSPDEIKLGQYDTVVCLDVLEHVPDPSEVVSLLAGALKPGGQLIVHAPFWCLSPAFGTHLRSNRRYSGDWRNLYGPHGLRAVDAACFWNPLVLKKTGPGLSTSPATWMARIRLAVGQTLLSLGRYWSTPHIVVAQLLAKVSQYRWTELEELQQKFAA